MKLKMMYGALFAIIMLITSNHAEARSTVDIAECKRRIQDLGQKGLLAGQEYQKAVNLNQLGRKHVLGENIFRESNAKIDDFYKDMRETIAVCSKN